MKISAEKTELMTNTANGIQREIKVNGQKLELACEDMSFKGFILLALAILFSRSELF